MKRLWAAMGVGVLAVFTAIGCNDYGNTFQANTGAVLSFVSPSNASAGSAALTITLTGSGFVIQTYATWDQKAIQSCVLTTDSGTSCATSSDTGSVVSVTAVVPAADLAKPGTHFIQTVNPHSGAGYNGLSNTVAFVVNPPPNPIPTISSISPNSAAAGSAAMGITITGTNFITGSNAASSSQVNWNTTSQTALAVTNITSTQIQGTVPSTLLTTAGSATVTVSNPPASSTCPTGVSCGGNGGGGTSPCPLVSGSTTATVCTFTITDPSSGSSATAANLEEETPAVSSDGRYVAYAASQDGHAQIFARDTCQGADSSCQARTVLISAALDGSAGTDDSHAPSMSSDGRYIAFSSAATDLTADSTTLTGRQVYLRDTCFGVTGSCTPATQLVSTDPNGKLVGTEGILPSISASGRFVGFLAVTASPSKAAGGTASKSNSNGLNSGLRQIFVRDTCLGAQNCTPSTTRISMQPGDGTESTTKPAGPAISGRADHVAMAGGNTATIFMRSVAVDDGVFLALTKSQQ